MTRIRDNWISTTSSQAVMSLLHDAGYQALFVGGCVRDALLGKPVRDIDIATDALPQHVIDLARAAGVKAVPTGIDHGTVTVVFDEAAFEITTFRKDIDTDGRRATVAFSSDVADDARRRDFTMNALYCDATGRVVDPLYGMQDLKDLRVRFIENPSQRIWEDYLRTLRFFRFHAWYGDPDAGMDAEALAAIADNLDGLSLLSEERVGQEVMRLLAAPDPAPAVAAMNQTGVLARILPGSDPRYLAPLVHLDQDLPPDPIVRLAAITVLDPTNALRLSRPQSRMWALLRDLAGTSISVPELAYLHGAQAAIGVEMLRAAMFERPLQAELSAVAHDAASQIFPVNGKDLMPEYQGEDLGKRLKELEKIWIASGFQASRETLLAS